MSIKSDLFHIILGNSIIYYKYRIFPRFLMFYSMMLGLLWKSYINYSEFKTFI